MKRKTIILLSIIYFGLFNQRTIINAQTKLLHFWHFNNTLPLGGSGGVHFGTNKMNSDYTKPSVTTGYLRSIKRHCV
jgi:hypothetical protein